MGLAGPTVPFPLRVYIVIIEVNEAEEVGSREVTHCAKATQDWNPGLLPTPPLGGLFVAASELGKREDW